jgi:replicative DNA helicase
MHDMSYDAHEVIPDLEDVGVGVLERLSVSGASKLNEVIVDVMTDVGARASGITKDGVRTYINSVDRLIHQWGNSDLIVVGARPAMGKTSFIVSAGLNMAKNNVPVGVFSLEMSSKQLVSRIISQELEIASDDIMKRAMDETRLMHVNKNLNKLDGLPMYFDDKAALSIEDFKVRAARMVKTHGVKCIFVDYLQLMTSRESNKRGTNREQEISSISRGLKVTAKELNIPIVVLSQLSREVEKRSDKRPLLSDLRESGSIEQDADQVGFLYRPEYYGVTQDQNGGDVSGIGEYICAKNRNGGLGIARMRFIPEYTKYCDESVGYAPSQMKPNTDFTQSANQIDEAPF